MTYSKDQLGLIKTFIENEPLATLIKAALQEGLAGMKDLDFEKSNEGLGQEVRARGEAHDMIESKFTELKHLVRSNPQPSSRNESR